MGSKIEEVIEEDKFVFQNGIGTRDAIGLKNCIKTMSNIFTRPWYGYIWPW